ncbi:DUF7697 family protein [Enterovirga sp. CN4-39]|uniref:DUF7697 family protein n=1 Tax=Enterovirga sp. CN4-39 TaxID=3400910 RepID=UPI003C0C2CE8
MIQRSAGQVRVCSMGANGFITAVPVGLDFGAIIALAEAMGAMSPLLAEVLPHVEPLILKSFRDSGEGADAS